MNIFIDEQICMDEKFWTAMFKVINQSYRIGYIKYKGKNYFNCSSSRYDGDKTYNKMIQNNIKPAHKNHPCKCDWNYNDSDHKKFNKKKVSSNEIEYVYSGKFNVSIIEDYKKHLLNLGKKMNMLFHDYFHSGNFNIDDLYNRDDMYLFQCDENIINIKLTDEYDLINELDKDDARKIILDLDRVSKSNQLDKSQIKFSSSKPIQLVNNTGYNHDHRGLNHTLIELPFETKINLGKEFTLEDLIISNSNLKSHKFDYWYELFIGTNCVEYDNYIEIELKFDHGS